MDEEYFINIEDARPGRQEEPAPAPRRAQPRKTGEPFRVNTLCCYLFLAVALGWFPLYSTRSYNTLALAKYEFFCTAALCFLGLSALVGVAAFLCGPKQFFRNRVLPPSVTDIGMILFFAAAGVSCLLSKYQEVAFAGSDYRHHGFVIVIMYLIVYLLLSRTYQHRSFILYIFVAASCVVVWIGLQNLIGRDPLGFVPKSSFFQLGKSVSTLGNLNFFSSYLCIYLPVVTVLFVKTTKAADTLLYGVGMLFGFGGLVVGTSDSGYFGIAVLLLLLPLVVKNFQQLARYFFALACLFAAGRIVGLFLNGPKVKLRYQLDDFSLSLVQGENGILLLALFAMLGMIFLIAYLVKPQAMFPKAVKWVYFALLAAAGAVVLGSFLWFSLADTKTQLGDLGNYLRFNDYWGTNRGYAWSRLLKIYEQFSLQDKLFGAGMDTVGNLLVPRYYQEMMRLFGQYFENAHNEYIQYLVTIGALGAGAYLTLVVSSAARSLKNGTKNPVLLAFGFAILCYAAQGVFNISQTMTTPVFFIVMGMAESMNRRIKREQRRRREESAVLPIDR